MKTKKLGNKYRNTRKIGQKEDIYITKSRKKLLIYSRKCGNSVQCNKKSINIIKKEWEKPNL